MTGKNRPENNPQGRRLFVAVGVLFRDVVFRDFVRCYFAFVRVQGIFYAAYQFGFEVLALFGQFFHALGFGFFVTRKALSVAGLSAGF